MEFQYDTILRRIAGCTPEAIDFIKEWCDSSPFIDAYTSGSTGVPKKINLLKADMLSSALSTNSYFNITDKSTLVCPLSANYIAGKMMIVRAMVSGARLWIETPSNKPQVHMYGNIDLIAVVPSQMPHLLANNGNRLSMRNILIGGASLPRDIASEIVGKGFNAYVSYGMTETCSHVALRKVDGNKREIYEALGDIHFSTDTRDCLVISSSTRSFRELVTNDIVELLDNRHFIWLGRFDNIINSGGIKIYPEEIEQALRDVIPPELEYYITKGLDKKWGEVPVLVISKGVKDMDKILSEARAKVKYKVHRPAKIIADTIEHTSTGKIIRRTFLD